MGVIFDKVLGFEFFINRIFLQLIQENIILILCILVTSFEKKKLENFLRTATKLASH